MNPLTISATSIEVYESCPKRYEVEFINKVPSVQSSAAGLGTVCHETAEEWVKNEYYKNEAYGWAEMQAIYDIAYWGQFSDKSRWEEGKKLMISWLERNKPWFNKPGRTVISTEEKKSFPVTARSGETTGFTYIIDRMDRQERENGKFDIEVVDYKTLSLPVNAADLKNKIQARAYALAAQLEYLDASFIWVTFDMFRYDMVGTVFTVEDNRITYKYIRSVYERILADDDPQENLGPGCRWCIRQNDCKTLNAHINGGGSLRTSIASTGPNGAEDLALRLEKLRAAQQAIGNMAMQTEQDLIQLLRDTNVTNLDTDTFGIIAGVTTRRTVDSERVAAVIGQAMVGKYATVGITMLDEILKKETSLTDPQKQELVALIRKSYSDPKITLKRKLPLTVI